MHIGAHFILFYQDFILLISSSQRLHRWVCCRKAPYPGSMGVKRHLALWEGNLVSGALMIMASVKRALPDLAPLAVAPCQAPWIVGQTERGGMQSGKKRRNVTIRMLSWMNSLPTWFFLLWSCSIQWRLSLPKKVAPSCLPASFPWVKTWGWRSEDINSFREMVVAPLWVQNIHGLRFVV